VRLLWVRRDIGANREDQIVVAAIAAMLSLSGSAAFAQPFLVFGSNSGHGASWLAGIQAGHNWQSGSFVYGIETDLSGTGLKTNFNTLLNTFPPATINTNSEIEWYGTVRGRFGWSAGQWLFYGTGGLAYGSVDLNSTITFNGTNSVRINDWRAGWVGGGGIEYKWSPNLIFSLNYQYINLGTLSFSSTKFISAQAGSDHAQFQVVTLGVSWLFTPDGNGPHGLWQGDYIGGHAGGDWGNGTSATYATSPPL
jgi:outer membrane immunogenic protein